MSKDLTQSGSAGSPLTSELFHAEVYKPTQGRIVRQLTALAIFVIVGLGSWRLYGFLPTMMSNGVVARSIAGVLLAAGLWFGFRLVNWPRFADFLIAVEAEMNKVTWPSKDELIRAAIVVIFTIFFLAVTLFSFDVLWQFIFNALGVTS
ncbi:protein translocase subunit secE/sec61 gamma [Neorhodopirellula lusitana]|uniref:Protein translocase subunit SecE n=1 Tax=Neorhodopirellula lusitana TaxID=445327 RepID=A0ABY1PW12_9BACT|nr:preprotein translocase subunit SecE [Neorhodopirellula lusitana]SMP50819.1 protein translocase subunit secE/sec61 gamma [Neorhodopirellula lusitana]